MKKILIFSTAYLPLIGGAEIAVKEITDRLGVSYTQLSMAKDEDIVFDLITARMRKNLPKEEVASRGVRAYRVGFGNKFDKFLLPVLGFAKAVQLNRGNNYQIIWSIMASWAGIAAARFKKKFPEKKLVLTLQEGEEEDHLKRYALGSELLYKIFIQRWHRMVIRKADYITAISNHLKDRAKKVGAKAEIEVIPNGANQLYFLPRAKVIVLGKLEKDESASFKEKRKKELSIKDSEKVILTVSRLVEKNGIEYLIKGVSLLENKDWKLLIVGSGKLEKELRILVKNLNIEKKVLFLGERPNEEVANFYLISDIFVRPSLSEGLGNVFLEAMSLSVPVIATPVGGIVDFLRDGETGWFCEVKDSHSIAEKIKYVFDEKNKNKVWEVIENAKKMVEEKYNWDSIASKMRNIFFKLIWD